MSAALTRHDALLRQCVEANAGRVFKTGGDAFYVALASTADAVAAALEAQRALLAEPWPKSPDSRSNRAALRRRRTARWRLLWGNAQSRRPIACLEHGGQSILSAATHDLCRDRLPPEATLMSLGEHRLRDLSRPRRSFSSVIPICRRRFLRSRR